MLVLERGFDFGLLVRRQIELLRQHLHLVVNRGRLTRLRGGLRRLLALRPRLLSGLARLLRRLGLAWLARLHATGRLLRLWGLAGAWILPGKGADRQQHDGR